VQGPVSKQGSGPRSGQPPASFPGADGGAGHSKGEQQQQDHGAAFTCQGCTVHSVPGLLVRIVFGK